MNSSPFSPSHRTRRFWAGLARAAHWATLYPNVRQQPALQKSLLFQHSSYFFATGLTSPPRTSEIAISTNKTPETRRRKGFFGNMPNRPKSARDTELLMVRQDRHVRDRRERFDCVRLAHPTPASPLTRNPLTRNPPGSVRTYIS
jgi:hypothetical protein